METKRRSRCIPKRWSRPTPSDPPVHLDELWPNGGYRPLSPTNPTETDSNLPDPKFEELKQQLLAIYAQDKQLRQVEASRGLNPPRF